MLARLADALARFTERLTVPACPRCRGAMTLRQEAAVDELPVAVERTYVCGRCGRTVTHCSLWAIPD